MAIALIVDAKKGMSALQLQRHLKVNYRTAWYLARRIREAMNDPDRLKLTGTLEIDKTHIGGEQKGPQAQTEEQRRSVWNPEAQRSSSARTSQKQQSAHALRSDREAR